MANERTIKFALSIPARRYIRYYEGSIRWIQVKAFDGTRVRFPASALRKFVTEDGIYGTFEMVIDENNKLLSLKRIEE